MSLDTVLLLSTSHIPELAEDLSNWNSGKHILHGTEWFFCFEEDCQINGIPMPAWLLSICIYARRTHGADWICFDRDADICPDLPTYYHG